MVFVESVYARRLISKRLFDILGSLVGLVIFSPFIFLGGILIFFETGLPLIYKNERVGRGGVKFWLYKFREYWLHLCTASDKKEALFYEESLKAYFDEWKESPVYHFGSGKLDPRRTPVGCWIERHFIGEMLQFWNVLRGEMSIVGPRPHQPREVDSYPLEYRALLSVLPGITGLAQIAGKQKKLKSFEDEVRLSFDYILEQSLWLDTKICLRTFVVWGKTWF
jgi:undecaprenyl-phosphate galactose phosphotransferase